MTTCVIDGCERTGRLTRGWCQAHYKRWLRYGDPRALRPRRTQSVDLTAGTKRCTKCSEWKPLDEFTPNKTRSTGRHSSCRSCENSRQRRSRATRSPERLAHDKAKRRDYQLFWLYGITIEQYENLLATQGGVCICGATSPSSTDRLHVDHDHATGEVRGLLCRDCNIVLGLANDDPVRLRKLASYLDESLCEIARQWIYEMET